MTCIHDTIFLNIEMLQMLHIFLYWHLQGSLLFVLIKNLNLKCGSFDTWAWLLVEQVMMAYTHLKDY